MDNARHRRCFDRDVLVDLSLGKLPDEDAERVATEVDACPTCRALMDTLDNVEDSVVCRIKDLTRTPAGQMDPQIEDALRQAEQISEVVWREDLPDAAGQEAPPNTSADETPPARLGQYELQERIGRGGMGTVWKALHTRLKRPVAIKLLPAERTQDPNAVSRFQQEMEAVGRLDHPNLVRAHDAGDVEGRHFLVMEFIDGVDLAKLVRSRGQLPVADACEVIRQAAIGLQHAHAHGLVHRDVKPSNVMLTTTGEVKVLDLGLARLTDDQAPTQEVTGAEQVMGTGDYIAPEQGQDSHQADARSDVYSLGCTLYFLLSGRPPFCGPEHHTFFKKVTAHSQLPVPPIREKRDDAPDGLILVLERMLAKQPRDRFQTGAEVAEALTPWTDGADLRRLAAQIIQARPTAGHEAHVDTPGVSQSARPTARTPPPERSAASRRQVRRWAALTVLLVILSAVTALAVRIATDRGELVIHSPDADLKVQVSRSGRQVVVVTGQQEYHVELRSGQYTLEIVEEGDRYALSRDDVEIQRGEAPAVTIVPKAKTQRPPGTAAAPLNRFALVQQPTLLPGAAAWTIETRGERSQITVMARSPNGDLIATGSEVGTIRIWHVTTGDLMRVIVEPDRVQGLVWLADDEAVAVVSGRLRIWEVGTGKLRWEAPTLDADPALSIAGINDGLLASGHQSGKVRLWNTVTGELANNLIGHQAAVTALACQRDGARLATGDQAGTIRLWALPDGKPIQEFKKTEQSVIHRLAWSPDGKRLVSSDLANAALSVRSEANGWQPRIVRFPTLRPVQDMGWSPDGKTFLVARGFARENEVVQLWDGDIQKELHQRLVGPCCVTAFAWAADSHSACCGQGDGGIFVYQPGRDEVQPLHAASIAATATAAWSPDGRLLLLAGLDGTCRVWDIDDAKQLYVLPCCGYPLKCAAWSPKADFFAVGSRDSALRVFETGAGGLHKQIACDGFVMDTAFSPSGGQIATAESNGRVRVWDLTSGEPRHAYEVPGQVISCLA
ncbi:MAG TPA: serine/threonine-protein kinase, partial [Candidatus Anammoximicrobium sp.]|nr:serine/threonine-protein kinase [Candidatus Anammoximicrobium sp.]